MDMQSINALGMSLTTLIITAAIGIGIFLLCRQLILWYFRINQIADDLHVIAQHYRALDTGKRPAPSSYSGIGSAPAPMVKR